MHTSHRVGLIAFSVALCVSPAFAHDPITTKVTFNKEVIRILQTRCAGCHVAGGVAPMSLANYEEARPWAKAIKEEILERRMPPWNAAKGFGEYRNDRSLSQLETELIVDWVEGGAPKGDDKDLPKAAAPVKALKADLVAAGGASPAVKAQSWISGWSFTPGSGAVDSAEFWIEDSTTKKRTYLGGWVPPETAMSWPEGTAQSLPAGSRVVVKLHFPDGDGKDAGSRLNLYFASKPPKSSVRHMELACGSTPVPARLTALALLPAGPMEMDVALPDGEIDTLGLFRADKADYHPTYLFRHPPQLPAGAKINAHPAGGAAGSCKAMLTYSL